VPPISEAVGDVDHLAWVAFRRRLDSKAAATVFVWMMNGAEDDGR